MFLLALFYRIMQPMHKAFVIPDCELLHEAFPEFNMFWRSFGRRPVDDAYFTTLLGIVLLLLSMRIQVRQVAIAFFAFSAAIATLHHPPCRSKFDGGAIEISSVIQVGILVLPRALPLRGPKEFQAVVPEKQIVQYAARPNHIVYLGTILVPVFSILKEKS